MQLPEEEVDRRIRDYFITYGPAGTQKPYDTNNTYYMEDRVRWLEMELVKASQTIEALCAVFQRIGK